MTSGKKGPSGAKAVFWWVGWILLTIVSFFVASWFWTPRIARAFGSVRESSAAVWWVVAVFGSWLLLLLPLIVLMYSKVDKTYEDARLRREAARASSAPRTRYRSVSVDSKDRLLPGEARKGLREVPRALRNGQLVTAVLRDGRRVPHVFVVGKKEVVGVYGRTSLDFRIADIVAVEGADLDRLPVFKEEEWLRIDGEGEA